MRGCVNITTVSRLKKDVLVENTLNFMRVAGIVMLMRRFASRKEWTSPHIRKRRKKNIRRQQDAGTHQRWGSRQYFKISTASEVICDTLK